MVKFNTLKITTDCLILDIQIEESSYYENVFLDSLIIDTDKTYKPFGPSSNPVYFKEIEYVPIIYSENSKTMIKDKKDLKVILDSNIDQGYKRFKIELTPKDFNLQSFDHNLFFIYVTVKGTPKPDTPCGKDNKTTLKLAVNLNPIIKKSFCYIKEMAHNCKCYDKSKFIHFILQIKSLEYAIMGGNIELALKHWYLLNFNNKLNINNCCNE